MSDTRIVEFCKMSAVVVTQAGTMADEIVRAFFRGPGDTIDGAMHRAARETGAPYNWLKRLRHRRDTLRDVPGSALLALAIAYRRACDRMDERYEMERARNDIDPAILRLADLVAGKADKGQ